MKQIILLRHGQSQWNLENRFTGWTDVDLTDAGREEARQAGQAMLRAGLQPRYMFTSVLRRAIHTLQIAAAEMELDWVPVMKDWHLNERFRDSTRAPQRRNMAPSRCISGAAASTSSPRC